MSRVKSVGYHAKDSVPEPGLPQLKRTVSTSDDQIKVANVRTRLSVRRIALVLLARNAIDRQRDLQNRQARNPSKDTIIPTIPLPPNFPRRIIHGGVSLQQRILHILSILAQRDLPPAPDRHDVLHDRPPAVRSPPGLPARTSIFEPLFRQRPVAVTRVEGVRWYPART